ncbi:MAG: hypothetical protein R3E34_10310 [Rhodocyclaceae bacterium]
MGEAPLDFGYDLAGRITGLDQNGTAYDQGFGWRRGRPAHQLHRLPQLRAYTDAPAARAKPSAR